MAKKKTILSDSFEQVAELGKTATKRMVKTTKNITLDVGTAKALEHLTTGASTSVEKTNGQNHTPLKMDQLQEKYKEQDAQKEANLRARLFQLSRQGESEMLTKKKQEEQQKEQQTMQEEQETKRKEEEGKMHQEQGPPLPSGKKRRSIFSPRKKAQEQHSETRPATGKQ